MQTIRLTCLPGRETNSMGDLKANPMSAFIYQAPEMFAGSTPPQPTPSLFILIYISSSLSRRMLEYASESFCMHRRNTSRILGYHSYPTHFRPRTISYCNLQYFVRPTFQTCRKINVLLNI